jgi:sporadic carbohydrate cluster 2OG-Fe(II) oxygenase
MSIKRVMTIANTDELETERGLQTFAEQGYAIVPSRRPHLLEEMRESIFRAAQRLAGGSGDDAEAYFNEFHKLGFGGAELNRIRMGLVEYCSKELEIPRTIFEAFRETLFAMVGPDVAAQKLVNVVVQQPGDAEQAPVHRDAPSNSHFEVIVWLPLVDVFRSKSMYILERTGSARALDMLKGGATYKSFCDYVETNGSDLDIPFGSACLFAAGLAHGVKINAELETRWVLNVRFKNLFSPYGAKGLAEYFSVLSLSPLSQVAFAFEKQEFGLSD